MKDARRGRKVGVWLTVAVIVVTGVLVAVWATRNTAEAPEVTASPSALAGDGCGDVDAQPIDLDRQVVEPEPVTCFVLEERLAVTVGAAALQPDDELTLTVATADGTVIGAASSAPDWDPEVSQVLDAGIYVVEVSGPKGPPPPFLLYTATFPPGAEQPSDEPLVPSVDACGTDIPWLADDAPVAVSDTSEAESSIAPDAVAAAHYACIEVTETVFAKVGAESPDPTDQNGPDLTLALYRVEGDPVLVRTADDAIGLDPEMSVDLEPGVYLAEVSAWLGGPTGDFEFYYDDDADLFRRTDVTPLHTDIAADVCDDAPVLSPGDTVTIEGERTYVCLAVEQQQRLTLQAATLTDQDLVLEVVGFDDGTPYAIAWADDNPYSQVLSDFDPLLDQTIPAGTWVVAVTTYFTGVAADYDFRAVPSEPR